MRNKIEIIPAILPKTFKEVEEGAESIQGLVKNVQVDICDGKFAPNPTWPYKKHDDSFEMIIHEQLGLPAWEKLDYEFDLMVSKPEDVVDDWINAGATRLVIHAESEGVADTIAKLDGRVEIGMALNIDTPISAVEQFRDRIEFVQCMGIRKVGFQGQTFDPVVIEKIKEIKLKYPELLVSVDGGVSLDNANALIEAGADRLVVGSAIFGSENVIDSLMEFKNIARSY